MLLLGVVTLPLLCGLGVYLESGNSADAPGEEVVTVNVTAGAPVNIEYKYEGAVRRRFTVWLRHGSTTANLNGSVSCRDTTGAYATFGQMFPPLSAAPREPEPGVIYVGGSLLTSGHRVTCQGSISAPADFAGRLVITEHRARPSDLLGL